MTSRRTLFLLLFLFFAPIFHSGFAQQANYGTSKTQLDIYLNGSEQPYKQFDDERLGKFTGSTCTFSESGKTTIYSGVNLDLLLTSVGVKLKSELKGKDLSKFVVLTGSDGFRAVVALPEFDSSVFLVATKKNGKKLGNEEGPLRLIVPASSRKGRWVKGLVRIDIVDARKPSSDKTVQPVKQTYEFPDFDPHHKPKGSPTRLFELSDEYPDKYVSNDQPWKKIDFRKKPKAYMDCVLDYCLEGNIENDFRVQSNKTRNWFHAPWLHDDGSACGNGREYLRGLTRERGTPPFEIHRKQDVPLENWAIGFYNANGGYTLGRVWENGRPNSSFASFPEGTVSFKLLFTDGAVRKVPFLKDSVTWKANIYEKKPYKRTGGVKQCILTERIDRDVRLLQVDIAVKDSRASKTGWVFGTFVYDASQKQDSPWKRLVPVGLAWGNDSQVFEDLNKDGAFVNTNLKENWLNENLIDSTKKAEGNQAYVRYHGLGGRLNGPVDNPISSCISCHGQAAVTEKGAPMPLANFRLKRTDFTKAEFKKYFSDVKPGSYKRSFDSKSYWSLDYSLQLAAGIRNYEAARQKTLLAKLAEFNMFSTMSAEDFGKIKSSIGETELPEVSRGEEE